VEWSPRTGETAVLVVLGVALGFTAVVVEPAGRVLLGGAALLALALALRDRLLRPRLAAGPAGVAVRTLSGTLALPWPQVRVRVREGRRWGLRSRLLELDTATGPDDAGVLVLLGRRDLGADPADVARVLRTWATSPPASPPAA
jgi:Bacterial PH domain